MDNIINRDRSSWYYLDLEDYEYSIRQEITSDRVNYNRNRRKRKAAERRQKHNRRIYFAIQRLIGLLFVFGTILAMFIVRNYGADVTFSIVTIPVGLMMVFSKNRCITTGRKK